MQPFLKPLIFFPIVFDDVFFTLIFHNRNGSVLITTTQRYRRQLAGQIFFYYLAKTNACVLLINCEAVFFTGNDGHNTSGWVVTCKSNDYPTHYTLTLNELVSSKLNNK